MARASHRIEATRLQRTENLATVTSAGPFRDAGEDPEGCKRAVLLLSFAVMLTQRAPHRMLIVSYHLEAAALLVAAHPRREGAMPYVSMRWPVLVGGIDNDESLRGFQQPAHVCIEDGVLDEVVDNVQGHGEITGMRARVEVGDV